MAPASSYRFGGYTLDLKRGCLQDGDSEVKLRRKSFEILCCFAANPGRLLSKDELMAAAWPGTIVSDDSLVQCVRDIRRALADDINHWIKTVPGRGYLFDAPVAVDAPTPSGQRGKTLISNSVADPALAVLKERRFYGLDALRYRLGGRSPLQMAIAGTIFVVLCAVLAWPKVDTPASAPPTPATPAVTAPRMSIGVLPFANLSGDPQRNHLAAALSDDLMTQLSRAGALRVISRSAPQATAEQPADPTAAGRELGVRYVVLGSLRRGEELGINIRLVQADSGAQLWADRLDLQPADDPEAQRRAVAHFARMIRVELVAAESRRSLRERPDNPDTTDLVVRGHALLDRRVSRVSNEEAERLFEAALGHDDASVSALVGLAVTQLNHVVNQWPPDDDREIRLGRAEDAITRALALVPTDASVQRVRGRLLRLRGDPEQAIIAFARAIELDPYFAAVHAELGRVKMDVGRAAETIGHIERARQLSPRDPSLAFWYFWAGQAALYTGDDAAAVDWLRRAIEANPGYENPVAWLAVAQALLGREDEARRLLDQYRRVFPDLAISSWDSAYRRSNAVVAAQRERIVAALRQLGLPE